MLWPSSALKLRSNNRISKITSGSQLTVLTSASSRSAPADLVGSVMGLTSSLRISRELMLDSGDDIAERSPARPLDLSDVSICSLPGGALAHVPLTIRPFTLFQKSINITLSGIRYLLPLITTSSVEIDRSAEVDRRDGTTSILPLLY